MKNKFSLLKEILIILSISIVLGFTVNAISPKGIPLIGSYGDRFAIDSSKSKNSDSFKQRGKLNKAGFYQPVNIPGEVAKQMFDEKIKFIDGREPHEFKEGHIKGAINIDYKEFKNKTKEEKLEILKNFPKEDIIISYCGSDSCEVSIDNAYEMAKIGYNDMKIYLGGYKDWKKLNYPTEK
ncbi:MAG: rhodanese-like domain-containing protein [Ignavibacteria bacterium]|nr:rhodanese-like domain-containing protein [Ignavibacteria bacterium]